MAVRDRILSGLPVTVSACTYHELHKRTHTYVNTVDTASSAWRPWSNSGSRKARRIEDVSLVDGGLTCYQASSFSRKSSQARGNE
ncbi:Hypothetical protein AJAP_04250 [Amycolatopsis japonica]|uniref:Uncharacterized protein n=1 Tax=Amycolatopsis japonica TaxID=208439 RepID=A0A075ULK7_9PSEU|nr:Hypothetical protein AJAP_04250 [Amycolatopsis japonica]